MIENKLKLANSYLLKLIELTQEGIDDIKKARKDRLDKQNKEKNELIANFLQAKSELDEALLALANSKPDVSLQELLSDEINDLLKQLRFNLNTLNAKNKEFAKYIISVKEFYDNLLETMLQDNIQMNGYESKFKSEPTIKFKV
ncbi:flagellar protein FlgN [Campylobacter canadensis]|uniref:Flagellar protein FlgN n=1 Tax=Campylobacter canadensis TaxID=449520 RepID=A0ABS7WQ88_9BACT|nr:flagellar protein FlgN [Campylobacter canadensis]MBZ7986928.1 flagellar protein FlgN [Campylobacter canadensis]MBZ7994249.1 flagellar protein FlgN [Campylobacter canadensis]MBZ7995759.1 flagellar protein FlgN [Campylobacter canadensis]MBZ7997964.1 flagellar protein FlgN [Campylobacter canadensis]MBZ7999581.1 flagellar protein FlgN [Campylobacter canadensis]